MSSTVYESNLLQSSLPPEPAVFTPTLIHTILDLATHAGSATPSPTVVVSQVTVVAGDPLTVTAGTGVAIVTVDGTSTTDVGVALSDVNVVVLKGTGGVDITFSNAVPPDSTIITDRAVVALTAHNSITIADDVASVIVVNTGDNTITGGDGADKIVTGSGNTTVDGGAGNDIIFTGSGNATVHGGDGDDTVITSNGNTTVDGGAGNDIIITGTGNSTINGGAGSDTIILAGSGAGNTTVDGGTGFDHLNIARTADQVFTEFVNNFFVITDSITGAITHANNVEYVSLLNGDVIVLCANDDQAAIAQMYETFFGHPGDASGLQYWFEHHAAGESMYNIAAAFANVSSFDTSDTSDANIDNFIEQLYMNTFGHGSDPDGKAHWEEDLHNGASFASVGLSFAEIAVDNYEVTTVTTIGNINIVSTIV